MWQQIGFVVLIGSCLTSSSTPSLEDLINMTFKNETSVTEKSSGFDYPVTTAYDHGDENRDCECVPYFRCYPNGTLKNDGTGLIDFRIESPNAKRCSESLELCCVQPDAPYKEHKIPLREQKGCGQSNPDGIGLRITGDQLDNVAAIGEFPWMVAVLSYSLRDNSPQSDKMYECGGSLIHPSVVLTAAHCVNKGDRRYLIRAGEWDTSTNNEPLPHQNRVVERIVIHPNFKSGSLHNDFALLILAEPVEIATNVDIVCLPDVRANFDFANCVASGWGKNEFGKNGIYMVALKKIELPVVPHDQCQRSLRTTRLGQYFSLDRSFICAGGEYGKDTCKGDGGSPLVCPLLNDRNRFIQAGIVSWGIGCGENRVPGVYGNVAAARPWIDEVLTYNNFDNRVYQYNRN